MAAKDDKSERFILHLKPLQGSLEVFGHRSLYDSAELEDVLQDVMLKAFRDFDLFVEGTNFRAWIFRYLNFGVLEANRRNRTHRHESLLAEPAVEEHWQPEADDSLFRLLLESPETVLEQFDGTLRSAILRLRTVDRSVLLLKAIGDFKYREIAEILGIPMGTVMSSLARARQQIRHSLIPPERDEQRECQP